MTACKFQLVHPTTDEAVSADFDLDSTPADLVGQLEGQGWLTPAKNGSYAVIHTKDNRSLADKDPFAAQNVTDNAALSFRVRAIGAAPRRTGPSPDRLGLDFESLKDLEGRGCFGKIEAFADRDLNATITGVRDAHRMRRYTAELRMRLPEDRQSFHDEWLLLVDLETSWETYPSADYRPHVTLLGRRPWHYRISGSGVLCTLPVGARNYVCGQHLGAIAGLLNADEPFEKRHDQGYQPDAYAFYRATFNGPVNPDMEIPGVRESVFLGEEVAPSLVLTPTSQVDTPPLLTLGSTAGPGSPAELVITRA